MQPQHSTPRSLRLLLGGTLLACLCTLAHGQDPAIDTPPPDRDAAVKRPRIEPSPPPPDDYAARCKSLARRPLTNTWSEIRALSREFGEASESAARRLYETVTGLDGRERVIAAELLTTRSEDSFYERGTETLRRIARDGTERESRIAAIRLLSAKRYSQLAFYTLQQLSRTDDDTSVVIEASRALYEIEADRAVLQPVFGLLEHEDDAVVAEAALTLAEIGHGATPLVEEVLLDLEREPTDNGRRARLLLRLNDSRSARRQQELEDLLAKRERENAELKKESGGKTETSGWAFLLDEVIQLVLAHSLRGGELDRRALYVDAIRGMLERTGPYSRFLVGSEVERQESQHAGGQSGFGMRLTKPGPGEPLVVVSAFPGSPAAEAGLRTGDRLLSINEVWTADYPLEQLDPLSKSAQATLRLLVQSWGQVLPRQVDVTARAFDIPHVEMALLPDGVIYARISSFGKRVAETFGEQITPLVEAGGGALVIDLRSNGGGLRSEAVALVDLFVSRRRGLNIATFLGPNGRVEETAEPSHDAQRIELPLTVLVNRYTASAAELAAGALQDFGRARIIGERTYGKGLEQSVFRLSESARDALGSKARVIVSTREIRLPLGRSFHGRAGGLTRRGVRRDAGIVPDVIEVDARSGYTAEQLAELDSIMFSSAVDEFVHRYYATITGRHAEGETWDPRQVPDDFDELYEQLDTSMSTTDVGRAIRSVLRLHLAAASDVSLLGDYSEDRQLQRAILEALLAAGYELRTMPQTYRALVEAHFGAEEAR